METVRALAARGVPFHVPLGIGAHLATFGVPKKQIVEHDWWDNSRLPSGLEIVSTPARHFNGRGVPGRIGALWTSWSLVGSSHRVFVSGDSGLTEAFREIQKREGPFDLALLEIGQYDPSWGDIHLGPQGALDAFAMLGAKHLLPIHWSTFQLGFHAWSEPAETLTALAAKRGGVSLVMPLLGEPVEPTVAARVNPWWRSQPPGAPGCPP
jgi:L-ascorbate metabolism protein UlaG (beta-lactamase superfamily)